MALSKSPKCRIKINQGSIHSGDLVSKAVLPKQCFVTIKAPVVEDSDSDPYVLNANLENKTYLASMPFYVSILFLFWNIL